jgi:L-fucose isomerase-like protein
MELSKQSKRIQPSPPVLVFRMHSEKRYEPRAFYAAGYIPIRAGPDVVSKHIISQVR